MKSSRVLQKAFNGLSLPAKEEWIEIPPFRYIRQQVVSLPAKEEWIEIEVLAAMDAAANVSSCKGRVD